MSSAHVMRKTSDIVMSASAKILWHQAQCQTHQDSRSKSQREMIYLVICKKEKREKQDPRNLIRRTRCGLTV